MPHPPPTRRSQYGFTLIETLIAVVIGVVIVGLVVAAFPRVSQQLAGRAQDASASINVTKQVQIFQEAFRSGGFASFINADSHSLDAVFTLRGAVIVPLQNDIHAQTLLYIPGLNAAVGDEVLLVAANGVAKLETVRSHPDTTHYVVDCPTGLPSDNTILAWPARRLAFDLRSGQIRRTTQGRTDTLGSSAGLGFSYVYQTPSGTFIRDPQGAPANTTSAGTLFGFIPMAIDAGTNIDRLAMVPLHPQKITRMLGCAEMGLTIPNEAQVKVTILGVPSGSTPDVTVHGPDSSVEGQRPVVSTAYMPVKPGSYSLTANDIVAGGETYSVTVGGSPAKLFDTWGTAFLQAKYVVSTGGVHLTVAGLPGSNGTNLSIKGQTPFSKTGLTNGSYEVHGLLPGTYLLAGTSSTVGSATYTAPAVMLTVLAGQQTNATLTFTAPAAVSPTPPAPIANTPVGDLRIQVSGLNGQSALAQIAGASNYSLYLTDGVTTVQNLPTGSYVLTPSNVGSTRPQSPSNTLTITEGQTTTVVVTYISPPVPVSPPAVAADVGSLKIIVQGLNGHTASATLIGPSNLRLTLADGSLRIDYLPVGDYVLRPSNSGTFVPASPAYAIHIEKNQLQSVVVKYADAQPKGNITLRVIGLPESTGTSVYVQGPTTIRMDGSRSTTPMAANNIPTGTYSVNAPTAVNSNGVTVTPTITPTKIFDLPSDTTIFVTVDYSASSPPATTPPDAGNTGGGSTSCPAGWSFEQCNANGWNGSATDPDHPHDPTFCAQNPGYANCGGSSGGNSDPPKEPKHDPS
ncbi:MSCRAMM family protein [Deinococcus ruber]|nr:prepilin-type N-terminal cleavage/methylation domain-containing protein [Deinococcus ruber]